MSDNKRRKSRRGSFPSALALLALCGALLAVLAARVSLSETAAVETAAVPSGAGSVPAASEVTATPAPSGPAQSAADTPSPSPEPTPEPEPEYFTISMVGDCTLAEAKTRRGWGTAYQSVVKKDYAYPFARTLDYFKDDYLTVANLECVLSDRFYDSIEQFVFLAPADYANILREGSVEFVTLANNHTMDFGQNAYNDTTASLDAAGVAYAGEDETYLYQNGDGLKIGIYCLYNRLTGNALSIQSAAQQEALVSESREKIRTAAETLRSQGAELLLACLHMGTEGSYETSAVQVDVCRAGVDAGFDLVYCTHAHRLQPAEKYGSGLILYGLGNWSFGGHTNPGNGTDPAAYDTGIAQVSVCRRGDRVTLESFTFTPCSISSSVDPDSGALNANTLNNYQPAPYTEGGAAWERTMSILNGAYAGANFVPDYGNVLQAMNG